MKIKKACVQRLRVQLGFIIQNIACDEPRLRDLILFWVTRARIKKHNPVVCKGRFTGYKCIHVLEDPVSEISALMSSMYRLKYDVSVNNDTVCFFQCRESVFGNRYFDIPFKFLKRREMVLVNRWVQGRFFRRSKLIPCTYGFYRYDEFSGVSIGTSVETSVRWKFATVLIEILINHASVDSTELSKSVYYIEYGTLPVRNETGGVSYVYMKRRMFHFFVRMIQLSLQSSMVLYGCDGYNKRDKICKLDDVLLHHRNQSLKYIIQIRSYCNLQNK